MNTPNALANGIFPTALRRLAEALDDHPEASFAYSPIVALRGGRPAGLVSAKPWDPRELRYGNYIDNMSLIRRSALERVGGWAEYMRIWEDFHLWARMAEAGMARVE